MERRRYCLLRSHAIAGVARVSMQLYTQVLLQAYEGTTTRFLVTWVPSKFAKVNKVLRLNDDETQWHVVEKYNTWTEEKLIPKTQDYKRQRKASDV